MSIDQQANAYIRTISPYQPGKPISQLAREMGIPAEKIVKLASNENPLGMSPRARSALAEASTALARYPDDFVLKQALATHNGLATTQIVLGNGSNDVLDLIARVFLAPGRSAVFSQHAFAVYALATRSTGAESLVAAAQNFAHDLDAMRAAVQENTQIIWIANPNNPTGTLIAQAQLKAFLHALPAHIVVVLDEAYNEYLPLSERYASTDWLNEFPNLVITRTFSKIYGLAGLRIGYALASAEIADLMNRVRQPFNCNTLALAAASAALDDTAFVAQSEALNRAGMEQMRAGLSALGFDYIPSFANFIAFKAGDAVRVNQKLLAQGMIVRPIAAYEMPEWLRVTIGTELENQQFLAALAQAR
ncbi:MAG: histidinol-phosphate transaminase [Pseudomonadota bacterium]